MKVNLKEFLTTLFNNPKEIDAKAKELLCPDVKNYACTSDIISFLNEPRATEKLDDFIYFVKKNNNSTNIAEENFLTEKDINAIKSIKDSKALLQKIVYLSGLNKIDLPEKFVTNFQNLAANTDSLSDLLLASVLVNKITTPKTSPFDKMIVEVFSCLTAQSSKPVLKENILNILEKTDLEWKVKAEEILRQYAMFSELTHTPNQISYSRTGVLKKSRNSMFYFDEIANDKSLIQSYEEVEDVSIEDAIKNFDMAENSNYIAYAIKMIEKTIKTKRVCVGYEVFASEAVFLTLCELYGKEINSDLLFAFANPLTEGLRTNGAFENNLEEIKQIAKDISGKEINFLKDVASEDSSEITKDEDETKKGLATGHMPKLVTSFIKDVTMPKTLTCGNILGKAKEIVGYHGMFINGVGKKKSKKITPEQKETVNKFNAVILAADKPVTKYITKKSAIKFTKDAKYDNLVQNFAEILFQIYEKYQNQRLELEKLEDKIKKSIDPVEKQKLIVKFNKKKEEYKNNIKTTSLKKELKKALREEFYRKNISDDYADEAESKGI